MSNWLPDLAKFPGPRYLALVNAIGNAITEGSLHPGSRLPPRRELAYRLGLSVNTIGSAYMEAERRGWVAGEVGRGTYVLTSKAEPDARYFTESRPTDVIDLSVCHPCVDPEQVAPVCGALERMTQGPDFSWMLSCLPVIGLDAHRLAGAEWLSRIGVPAAHDERIILTNGCSHGLLVVLATLAEPGSVIVTEALADHGLISLANVLHLELRGLAIDEFGIRPDAFEAACRAGTVRALVTTPTLSNPTCALMPEDRRRAIAATARRYGVAIVEDDVFRPLVTDCPPPLVSFAPELGYYLTSLTKAALSGLRTGYLLAPEHMVTRLVARVRATSWTACPAPAQIATHMIRDGSLDSLIDIHRKEISARQAIADRFLEIYGHRRHSQGLNVWLPLPAHWRGNDFVAQARHMGVAVISAEPFSVGRQAAPHAVRISIGAAADRRQLEKGLRQLSEILSMRSEPAPLNL